MYKCTDIIMHNNTVMSSTIDVTGSGRGLLHNHQHESSHASTLTEGSHESHDTSLESHETSIESHDMREASVEGGGREGREECVTEEAVRGFEGEQDERRRDEERNKGEENGKKEEEEEVEEEEEHTGIKDNFAEEEEGTKEKEEEEKEVLFLLEEAIKEEEKEEEEAAVEDEEEENEGEKEDERTERKEKEKEDNYATEDAVKADSREAQMKDVSPTHARKEERAETEKTQEDASHKENESKEEEEEEEERRKEVEEQERKRAITDTEETKEEKVSRDESPQEKALSSGSEEYPVDGVREGDKEERRELREPSNGPAAIPPPCTRQGEGAEGGGGGEMGVVRKGVGTTSTDGNYNGLVSSGSVSMNLDPLESVSQGAVQAPLDRVSGRPEQPPGAFTAWSHDPQDNSRGFEPGTLQDRPLDDVQDTVQGSGVQITVQDTELSAGDVEWFLDTAQERRESAGSGQLDSLEMGEGSRQRSLSPQRSALEGSCEGQKSEFEGSCEDVDGGGGREGEGGGGREGEPMKEAEDVPEERMKHGGHMILQQEAILSSDSKLKLTEMFL